MVPKVFEPLKFYCTIISNQYVRSGTRLRTEALIIGLITDDIPGDKLSTSGNIRLDLLKQVNVGRVSFLVFKFCVTGLSKYYTL